MRSVFTERLLAAAALVILIVALVAVDDRVREQMSSRFVGPQASTEIVAAGTQARGLAWVAYDAVRDQSLEHAPLTIFAIAATVLVFFMLRL
jgi:hypothetical protein